MKLKEPATIFSFERVYFSDYKKNICYRNVRNIEDTGNDQDRIKKIPKANNVVVSSFLFMLLFNLIHLITLI